jgi:hypothetical protein
MPPADWVSRSPACTVSARTTPRRNTANYAPQVSPTARHARPSRATWDTIALMSSRVTSRRSKFLINDTARSYMSGLYHLSSEYLCGILSIFQAQEKRLHPLVCIALQNGSFFHTGNIFEIGDMNRTNMLRRCKLLRQVYQGFLHQFIR